MKLDSCEEFQRADKIVDAICEVGGITYFQLLNEPKSALLSTLRGICCVISWEEGIHARRLAKLIHRTRGNVLNQTKRYRGFLSSKDKLCLDIYNKVKERLKTTDDETKRDFPTQ